MKNKLGGLVLLVSLLTFGLAVTGCNNGSGGGGGGGGDYVPPAPTQYTLNWGAFRSNFSMLISEMTSQGVSFDVQDTANPKKWALIKGSRATEVFNGFVNQNITYTQGKEGIKGTLSELAEYKGEKAQNNVQTPAGLKTAIKGAVPPIFGICDGGNGLVAAFYIY